MNDSPPHVLVVEDDPDQRALFLRLLEREGYRASGVATGAQAVDRAELERPHILFMDIGLEGGMDGIEAALLVRRRTGLPVVFLTGRADWETLERARAAEPFGYVLKPAVPAQLRAAVEIALDAARREGESRRLREEVSRLEEELAEARGRVAELQARLPIPGEGPAA